MSKVDSFKEWCKELKWRHGLPPQIKVALEAIAELEQSISDSNTSAFGDGWYDGFLEAKKLSTKDEGYFLDDIDESEILEMSEHAESEHAESKQKEWPSGEEEERLKQITRNGPTGEHYKYVSNNS